MGNWNRGSQIRIKMYRNKTFFMPTDTTLPYNFFHLQISTHCVQIARAIYGQCVEIYRRKKLYDFYFFLISRHAMSDKTREGMSGGGPVFGVPLHQCVDASSWRRRPGVVPTGLESASQPQTHLDEANTQHKADLLGRISSGSIFDSRSMERVSHALTQKQ